LLAAAAGVKLFNLLNGMAKIETNSKKSKKAWERQLNVIPWHPDTARKIQNPYLPWLAAQPWTFFCTGTTRYQLTQKSARRLAERFYKAVMNQGESVNMFWASEPFDVKEGHHIHFLMYIKSFVPDNALFDTLVNLWQWTTGNKTLFIYAGTNRIEWQKHTWNAINLRSYDNKRGAAGYTAKYMNKTRADYDYINSYSQLRSTSEITEEDYCPAGERKRRDKLYHIGRALQECNSAQRRPTDARR